MSIEKYRSLYTSSMQKHHAKVPALFDVASALRSVAVFRSVARSKRCGVTVYEPGVENIYPKPERGKALPKRRKRQPSEQRVCLVPKSVTVRAVEAGVTASYGNLTAWGHTASEALEGLTLKVVFGPQAELVP